MSKSIAKKRIASIPDHELSEENLELLDRVSYRWRLMEFSPVTISNYRAWAKRLLHWLDARKLSFSNKEGTSSFPTFNHLESWLNLHRSHARNSKIARNAAINRFIAALYDLGVIHWEKRTIDRVISKEHRDAPEVPSSREMDALYRSIARVDSGSARRLHAVVSLWHLVGMRVSEVIGLKLSQVKRDKDGTYISKVKRKWGHTSDLALGSKAALALDQWLSYRLNPPARSSKNELMSGHWAKSPYLFPGRKGGPLTYQVIWRELSRAGASVGLVLHPHLLRHIFATRAIEKGVDIHALRDVMGHRHISSLDTYLHSTRKGRRRVVESVEGE